MKMAANWVLWTVQMLIMVVAMVLFYWPARLLFAIGRALRDNLGQSLMRGPYYWFSVQRRKLRGEPLWQEHDWMLGVPPPDWNPQPIEIPRGPATHGELAEDIRETIEEQKRRLAEVEAFPPETPLPEPPPLPPFLR